MAVTHFYNFFQIPRFLEDFSDNIAPMKSKIKTKINSLGKVVSLCLENYKSTLNAFFIHNTSIIKVSFFSVTKKKCENSIFM